MSILWEELYAIVCAVHTWGHLWRQQKILFHYDNIAVVDIWKKGSTRDTETMSLVHMLYFRAAHHHINIVITHIAGFNNITADPLSSFQNQQFQELGPQAQPTPYSIPAWPTPSFIQPFNMLFTTV